MSSKQQAIKFCTNSKRIFCSGRVSRSTVTDNVSASRRSPYWSRTIQWGSLVIATPSPSLTNVSRSPAISRPSPTIQCGPLVIDTPLLSLRPLLYLPLTCPPPPPTLLASSSVVACVSSTPYPSRATRHSPPPSPAPSRVLLRARLRISQERGRHGRGTGAGTRRRQEVPSASPPYYFSHFYFCCVSIGFS